MVFLTVYKQVIVCNVFAKKRIEEFPCFNLGVIMRRNYGLLS